MNGNESPVFPAVERAVRRHLEADGYSVINLPVQKWGARYFLNCRNSGGGLSLAFGPLEREGKAWRLPFKLVRESGEILRSISCQDSTPSDELAARFLYCVEPLLNNRLPLVRRVAVNVGVGLRGIEEAIEEVVRKQMPVERAPVATVSAGNH
jgi:hypothetical protein